MSGNDIIHSKGGDDVISTGAGDDTVFLKTGNYTVDLGAGDDIVYLSTSMSIVEGGNAQIQRSLELSTALLTLM